MKYEPIFHNQPVLFFWLQTCMEQHCIKWSPYPVLGGQLSKSPICFFLITAIFTSNEQVTHYNPSIPMSDQDRISPYNIKQTSDENKEKYQLGDYKLIQYIILQTNITRTVW